MSTTVWTSLMEPSSVAGKARSSSRAVVSGRRRRPAGVLYHIVACYGPSIRRGGWSLGAHGSHERWNIQRH